MSMGLLAKKGDRVYLRDSSITSPRGMRSSTGAHKTAHGLCNPRPRCAHRTHKIIHVKSWQYDQNKYVAKLSHIHHDMIFARIRSWRSRDEFQSQSVARKLLGVLLLVQEVRGSTCTASTSAWLASASLTRLVAGRPEIAGRGRGPAGRPRVLGDPRHAAAVDRVPGRRPGRLFRIPATRFPCFRERLGMKLKGRVGHKRQSSAGLGAIGLS
jgi:hypothetical protein